MSVARIGAGPFTIEDYWMPDEVASGPSDFRFLPGTDVGRCACCGAEVSYRAVLLNQADGLNYIVGRTCAIRAVAFIGTTETQLKAQFARMAREVKFQKEEAKRAAEAAKRAAERLESRRGDFHRAIARDLAERTDATQFTHALLTLRRAAEFECETGAPLFPALGFVVTAGSRSFARPRIDC